MPGETVAIEEPTLASNLGFHNFGLPYCPDKATLFISFANEDLSIVRTLHLAIACLPYIVLIDILRGFSEDIVRVKSQGDFFASSNKSRTMHQLRDRFVLRKISKLGKVAESYGIHG
jgi:hypothetical protein